LGIAFRKLLFSVVDVAQFFEEEIGQGFKVHSVRVKVSGVWWRFASGAR
jgi:hypothetical protein